MTGDDLAIMRGERRAQRRKRGIGRNGIGGGDSGRAEDSVFGDGGAERVKRALETDDGGIGAEIDRGVEQLRAQRRRQTREAETIPPLAAIDRAGVGLAQSGNVETGMSRGGDAVFRADARAGADGAAGPVAGIGRVVLEAAFVREHDRDRGVENRIVAHRMPRASKRRSRMAPMVSSNPATSDNTERVRKTRIDCSASRISV